MAAAIKENMASFDDGKTALCLMGHGTEADSNADYAKMQEVFKNEGLTQFFVGTVEAEPTCEDVIAAASEADFIPYVENAEGKYTYDVPVEALDEDTACAAWSIKKEQWYDRTLVFESAGVDLRADALK